MKKTYITTMPNHIGAFLKASECLSGLGINITRVSYNKAVDSHTLFIDAEGPSEKLLEADKQLAEIGYLHNEKTDSSVLLLEFCLKDVPGSVTEVLVLISKYNFNISYISSQENGTDYQYFKMGLFVEDADSVADFLAEAEKLCKVRVIDYNHSEKVFDNSIFYNSFVNGLTDIIPVAGEVRNELLVNVNLAMQTLDEQGLSPFKTFDSIRKFAELLAKCRGEHFNAKITQHQITENTVVIVIEPPCGSNTIIIRSGEEVLFVDCGYAIYRNEMLAIINRIIPDFSNMKKQILITHADVDHCGLLDLFDEVVASKKTAECLALEYQGCDGYREQNPLHKPYIRMCKILTLYEPTSPENVNGIWQRDDAQDGAIEQVGEFEFGELYFDVYEGKGGHLPGEIVLVGRKHHVVFSGDIYINIHGLTPEQAEYNKYAPILMTSVDTNSALCAVERNEILNSLEAGEWKIFGAHGCMKNFTIG